MSNPIDPATVEKATLALTNDRRERHGLSRIDRLPWTEAIESEKRNMRAALEAVADDLRAEGAAEAWDEAVDEAHGCGWVHYQARQDLRARNPYRADASTALGVKS